MVDSVSIRMCDHFYYEIVQSTEDQAHVKLQ
jgi:hypothetical protein